jgi:CubicO group peptidase (beta-lactamase class C family)
MAIALANARPSAAQLPDGMQSAESLQHHRRFIAAVDTVLASSSRSSGPGCAVGVYRAERVLFARGYGMSDLERSTAITPHTVFDVGSITKQLTAAAIMTLVREGRASLEDTVGRYVPDLPRSQRGLRLADVLTHTGGVPDYLGVMFSSGRTDAALVTQDTALAVIRTLGTPRFAPGTAWEYSNSGFVLLAEALRTLTGAPYPHALRARLLAPLGMDASVVMDDYTMVIPGRASGYHPLPYGGFARVDSHHQQVGDGGLFTTVLDLARWHAYLVGEAARPMREPARLRDGRRVPYGLGLVIGTVDGQPAVWHAGGGGGFASALLSLPGRKLGVAVLCNLGSAPAELYARTILRHAIEALGE